MAELSHDIDVISRFLGVFMTPGTVLELRAFRSRFVRGFVVPADSNMTLSGWYDNPNDLMVDATRARGTSMYVTVNPVDPDLLARSCNRLTKSTHATKDEDILSLRYAFIDIDPVRKADISSTDAELALAMAKRDLILAENPDLAACSISGSSGNGAYILARINDLPNDATHKGHMASFLAVMAAKYSDAKVDIDVKTKNPSRVCCLLGTVKTKGSNVPNRPWRVSTLDGIPIEGQIFDIAGFVARHADLLPKVGRVPAVASRPTVAAVAPWSQPGAFSDVDELTEKTFRASRYLASMAPAISGQGGHAQMFDAACALVKGYDLAPHEARPVAAEYNQRCDPPWSDAELDHKLDQADKKPDDKPRGYLFRENREGYKRTDIILPPGSPPPPAVASAGQPGDGDEGPLCLNGYEDNPHRIARQFTMQNHAHPLGLSLRYWNGEFHSWTRGAYVPVRNTEIKGKLSTMMCEEFEAIHQNKLMQFRSEQKDAEAAKLRPIPVTTNLTGHVYQAMSGLCLVEAESHPNQPCWLGGDRQWPTDEILPMRNAIVHLPSFLAGQPCTQPPTPQLFCPYVLTYDWQPDAPDPVQWLKFLEGVFPDDQESIDTLQEWFGLQLVPVTKYQKMMAFIGPPGAGKGVISSIMREMIGESNCCGPTLGGFSETFGLQTLIGKLAAIIDDARLSGRSDQATIMERLLSISGEGTLDVRRMYRPQWSGVLSCRITLISNELPRLNDNSNALARRFIVLRFTESHVGREDPTLKAKFRTELPGILLWAARGLKRLNERGQFIQPKSGMEIHDEMKEISSPIGCFVRDCCTIREGLTVDKSTIYNAWKQWCEENGRKEVGELNVFARNLRSVVPSLKSSQPRGAGGRLHIYKGIGLVPPEEMEGPNDSGLSSVDFGEPPAF